MRRRYGGGMRIVRAALVIGALAAVGAMARRVVKAPGEPPSFDRWPLIPEKPTSAG